jgi:hypothetical protein
LYGHSVIRSGAYSDKNLFSLCSVYAKTPILTCRICDATDALLHTLRHSTPNYPHEQSVFQEFVEARLGSIKKKKTGRIPWLTYKDEVY